MNPPYPWLRTRNPTSRDEEDKGYERISRRLRRAHRGGRSVPEFGPESLDTGARGVVHFGVHACDVLAIDTRGRVFPKKHNEPYCQAAVKALL